MLRPILALLVLTLSSLHARTIKWYCDPGTTNRMSNGQAMDASFHFELGVFKDGFVPTSANTAQWAGKWVAAQSAAYNPTTQYFTGSYTVTSNASPFVENAQAYIRGLGGINNSEWILLRASSWLWPQPGGIDPVALEWNVANANQVILGSLNSGGALMQSASINGGPMTYAQWRDAELSGVALNGPEQDADGDGIPNVMEFVLGTPPQSVNPLPPITVSVVMDGGVSYLQSSIPRRADRAATLRLERSTDLVSWSSGPTVTQVVSETPLLLVAKSMLPVTAGQPKLFLRWVAELP